MEKDKKKRKGKKKREEALPVFLESPGSLPGPTFDLNTGPILAFIDLIHFSFAVTCLALFWGFVGVGFAAFSSSWGTGTALWTS